MRLICGKRLSAACIALCSYSLAPPHGLVNAMLIHDAAMRLNSFNSPTAPAARACASTIATIVAPRAAVALEQHCIGAEVRLFVSLKVTLKLTHASVVVSWMRRYQTADGYMLQVTRMPCIALGMPCRVMISVYPTRELFTSAFQNHSYYRLQHVECCMAQ